MHLSHILAHRTTTTVRSRLAPTPSGYLHVGNAFSFVLTWLLTRAQNGSLHLRIDDLDSDRTRPEYIRDIFETLEWLGLDYDSGPRSEEDFRQNWSQRRRLSEYNKALIRLREQNDLFACECSRSTALAFSENGIYTGLCRNKQIPLDKAQTAWRFRSDQDSKVHFLDLEQGEYSTNTALAMGDVVLRRKDGIPAYQIASLTDDILDGITFIVRGSDLLPSTAVQCVLAQRLQWSSFQNVQFLHHHLLSDAKGKKLSKSQGAESLKAWREAGRTPHKIYTLVAEYLGITSLREASIKTTAQELLAMVLG